VLLLPAAAKKKKKEKHTQMANVFSVRCFCA